jgi:DNA polymerase III epsilon subunit-like protein
MNLIFLDTETTGLTPNDRLIEVAYCLPEREICSQYFMPPCPLGIDAMAVNHITDKMIADAKPFQHSEMYFILQERLQDHVLVAHNADFDIGMLEREGLRVPRYICTKQVAKELDLAPKHNLQYLRYSLGLDVEANPHSAAGDVAVLMALYNYIAELKDPAQFIRSR